MNLKDDGRLSTWLLMLAILVTVIITSIIVFTITRKFQRRKFAQFYNLHIKEKINASNNEQSIPLLEFNTSQGDFRPLNELLEHCHFEHKNLVTFRSFKTLNELARGYFGIVYKGVLNNIAHNPLYGYTSNSSENASQLVAIKTNETSRNLLGSLKVLLDECKILQLIPAHQNVLAIVGVCVDRVKTHGELYLLTEFCANGSLLDYVKTKSLVEPLSDYTEIASMSIKADDLLNYSTQIAAGLLHLSKVPILHRDLGLRNILLTNDKVIKIADFGLSKQTSNYETKSWEPPWQWLDLNYYETGKFTQWSDVWSFGVVLWELWSLGSSPYADWDCDKAEGLTRLKCGDRLDVDNLRACPNDVKQLMLKCWKENPIERPDFQKCYNCFAGESKMPELCC